MSNRPTEHNRISKDRLPCHEDKNQPSVKDCLEEFMERNLTCRLPWGKTRNTSRSFPACDKVGPLRNLLEVFQRLGEADIPVYQMTGCHPPCKYLVYHIKCMMMFA